MEREILLTGIGGQGVQLAALVLAQAALAEGRDVQLFGSYGGMMRGGNTDATVVVADDTVRSPPTVTAAWGALVLHHDYAAPVLACVREDGLVVRNVTVWEGPADLGSRTVVEVPATEIAAELGTLLVAAMVMLGALARVTGVVSLEGLAGAVRTCVPPYRRQHVEANVRALEAGSRHVPGLVRPAWAPVAETAP